MAAIYAAEIYCDACAQRIRKYLIESGNAPEDPDDEYSFDSDDYPKVCGDDEESDTPQHCASGESCVNAEEFARGKKCGYFFRNPITTEGLEYISEYIIDDLFDGDLKSPAIVLWLPEYGDDHLDAGTTLREYVAHELLDRAFDQFGDVAALDMLVAALKKTRKVRAAK